MKKIFLTIAFLLVTYLGFSQVGFHSVAGIRPSLTYNTTEITTWATPSEGLMLYNSTTSSWWKYENSTWTDTRSVASSTVDASGFSGNLTTTDDTIQEIANALDALSAGGGGLANVVEDLTPQLGGTLDTQGNNIESTGNQVIKLDSDANGTNSFIIQDDASSTVFSVTEAGVGTFSGGLVVSSGTITGDVGDAVVDAGAFNGNLTGTDDTLQEIANAVDDLPVLQDGNISIPSSTTRHIDLTASSNLVFRQNGLTDLFTISGNGDVTVQAAATFNPGSSFMGTQILAQSIVTGAAGDYVIITDASDGGLTKRVDISAFLNGGTPDDDSVTPAKMADGDFGDFTVATNVATIDAGVVGSSKITDNSIQEIDLEVTNSPTNNYALTYDSSTLGFTWEPVLYSTTVGEPTGSDRVLNIVSLTQAEYDAGTPVAGTYYLITDAKTPEVIAIACSDLTTDITTGTSKAYFRMPWAATLTDVKVSLLTAGTTTGITVDINENGVSVLSTKLTTDATEETSETAVTAAVISDSALADDAEITIDFDAVPTGGQGVIVYLYVEY